MHRWAAVAGVVVGCHGGGGGSTAPPEPRAPVHDAAAPDAPPVTTLAPDAACARFSALADAGCGWTQRFPAGMRDAKICVGSLTQWLAPETHDREKLEQLVTCWALDCDPAADCMANIQTPPPSR